MYIHIVQQGETIDDIAVRYGISANRLILDNGLIPFNKLVIGQALVIVYPEQTYTIQEGDTLASIADQYSIPVMQLLRNNPNLSDREYIYPGETIVISYNNIKGNLSINGFVNAFINHQILKKTLPYLTYLSIFGYRTLENGDVFDIDDTEIIRTAKLYGVAPIMYLTSMTLKGISNYDAVYRILKSDELTEYHIRNILNILRKKGFYGANLTLQFLNTQTQKDYERYFSKLSKRLHEEGFFLFVTLIPNRIYVGDCITYEKIDYTNIGQMADGITLMNFNWGSSYDPPSPVDSAYMARKFLGYALAYLSPCKTDIGMSVIGYDWQLPYIIGVTKAHSLSNESAISLASEECSEIEFDEISQTPYFCYTERSFGIDYEHVVWVVDGRSVDVAGKIIQEYNLRGLGAWNCMNYFPQLWLVLNTQYEIDKVL